METELNPKMCLNLYIIFHLHVHIKEKVQMYNKH